MKKMIILSFCMHFILVLYAQDEENKQTLRRAISLNDIKTIKRLGRKDNITPEMALAAWNELSPVQLGGNKHQRLLALKTRKKIENALFLYASIG